MKILPDIDTQLTSEKLNNIPYLQACLKESLRMKSVAPIRQRVIGKNIVLNGYQVPKGV